MVIHCSATRCNVSFTVEQLRQCHLQRGFKDIGYHFYITRNGELHHCRPVSEPGAHVRGFNRHSIGTVSYTHLDVYKRQLIRASGDKSLLDQYNKAALMAEQILSMQSELPNATNQTEAQKNIIRQKEEYEQLSLIHIYIKENKKLSALTLGFCLSL